MIKQPLARPARMLGRLCASMTRARIVRETRGNVMLIFAFAVLPVTFATGMGIDYGIAMRLQTRLNAVADAAALSAVSNPMMKQSMLTACGQARATFVSQMSSLYGLTLNTASPANLTITMTDSLPIGLPVTITCPVTGTIPVPVPLPLQRTVTVTYRGESANTFSSVLGWETLTVKGTSTAKTTLAPYIDIHLALDTSQSMGLAASEKAAADLWRATTFINGRGCQFGCHVKGGEASERFPNELIANWYGIPMRVDVEREAAEDMIQTAQTSQGLQSLYRFGLYRIGRNSSTITPLTANLSQALSDVSSLSLGPNDATGFGDTNLPEIMTYILPRIIAKGNGTSQTQARAFLFLVTDGVTDLYGGNCTFGHCTKPIDPATCQAYKTAGITVGIVYTTYLPTKADPTNPSNPALRDEYLYLIKDFADPSYTSPNPSDNSRDIGPALQACASPGWFFEASDQTTIHAAMSKLFAQAAQSSAITR